MRRYWARSAPWRPPDRRSPTASTMGRGNTRTGGCSASGPGRPRGARYLQTLFAPLRQFLEQQFALEVQEDPDGRHAGSVVVVLLVDVVVVVVTGAAVVVVGTAVVVVVLR